MIANVISFIAVATSAALASPFGGFCSGSVTRYGALNIVPAVTTGIIKTEYISAGTCGTGCELGSRYGFGCGCSEECGSRMSAPVTTTVAAPAVTRTISRAVIVAEPAACGYGLGGYRYRYKSIY